MLQVYCISSGKTLPQWLTEKKKRSLKKDDDYRRRLELLQDLHFPTAAQRMKITPDGEYVFVSGIHPPQVCAFGEGWGTHVHSHRCTLHTYYTHPCR